MWNSQSNSGLDGEGMGVKERKKKGKEKARQGHLRGMIGRNTEACSMTESLVGGPANRVHLLAPWS